MVATTATTDVAAHDFLCMQLLLLPCYPAGFRRLSGMQGPADGLHKFKKTFASKLHMGSYAVGKPLLTCRP